MKETFYVAEFYARQKLCLHADFYLHRFFSENKEAENM